MQKWAKLYASASGSADFALATNTDRNAGLLFCLMLPHADVWGTLSGHERLFMGSVCGLIDFTWEEVQAALDVLEAGPQPMIRRYTDSRGLPWIHIPAYHRYQAQKWERVAEPDHDLPPWWEPPESLETVAKAHPECPAARWRNRVIQGDAEATMKDRSRSGPGPVQEWSRTSPGPVQDQSRTSPGVVPDQSRSGPALEVEVRSRIINNLAPSGADGERTAKSTATATAAASTDRGGLTAKDTDDDAPEDRTQVSEASGNAPRNSRKRQPKKRKTKPGKGGDASPAPEPMRDDLQLLGASPNDTATAAATTDGSAPTKQETETAAAVRAAFEALTGESLPSGTLAGYSGLVRLVQEHGLPMVRAWTDWLRTREPGVPEGASAWKWFCAQFRRALTRDFEWRDNARSRGAVEKPSTIGLRGWPAHPERVRDDQLEVIREIASSPDFDKFPDLYDHFNGLVVLAIQRERDALQEAMR